LNLNALYNFPSTFTFTSAGVGISQYGPTLSQCRTAYSSYAWTQNTVGNYLNMTTQGIQEWTVPFTGSYVITAGGAQANNGGRGAYMTGTFSLTKGTIVNIVVGQQGSSYSGGGGSFVYMNSSGTLLIAAGGGGSNPRAGGGTRTEVYIGGYGRDANTGQSAGGPVGTASVGGSGANQGSIGGNGSGGLTGRMLNNENSPAG
jgi:hypothetical protein